MLPLSSVQFAEWKAFYDVEPFGDLQADLRAGQVAATVANYAGKMRKEHSDPARPGDFLPALMPFEQRGEVGPVLLADPKAQADLIRAKLFRK
jgi:hypothetical protein